MSPSTPSSTVPVSSIEESTYHNESTITPINLTGTGIDAISTSINESKGKSNLLGTSDGDEEEEEEDGMMITNGITSSLLPNPPRPSSPAITTTTTHHHHPHHQHGIYKTRRHARSKSPVLKRVSFGSSKGSMVETLIYDHNEDDLLKDKANGGQSNSSSERYLNGNHLSNYNQPIHFHYPINRRLGSRVASDSTISSSLLIDRPSRVRVSLYESGRPGSIVSPETPEPLSTFNSINNNNNQLNCCSTISRIVNPPSISSASNYPNHHHQQQSISHSTLSSSTVNHPHYNQDHHHQQQQLTLDLVKMMERKVSVDSGIENPFRPGGELSREAETIVNLIKEGKPITPTTPTKELTSDGDSKILNGISNNQIPSSNHQLTPINGKLSPSEGGGTGSTTPTRNNLNHSNGGTKLSRTAGGGGGGGGNGMNGISADPKVYPQSNDSNSKLNGSSKLMLIHTTSNGGTSPGIVEVERSIVTPTEPPKADMVTIKKQKKCICCVVQ